MKRVLVISPHPDDEAIGCGGTICRHVRDGDSVDVIFLTSGERGGHDHQKPEDVMQTREIEAATSAQILQIRDVEFWREPDAALTVTPAIVQRLVNALARLAPAFVYVPHDGEMHADHRASCELVREALAELDPSVPRPVVLMYEVWTPLQVMDVINDITAHIETKMNAIRAYRCQNDVLAFDDAFRGLARYRGEMFCWPEGDYAEVFQRLR